VTASRLGAAVGYAEYGFSSERSDTVDRLATKRYPVLDDAIVRSLCEVLGRTEGGLTNKEIDELLAAARVPDPTPQAPRGTYVVISKRDRLFNALSRRQRLDGCGNAVLAFVGKALAPVRFHGSPAVFEAQRAEINVPLAFAGYQVDEAGRVRPMRQAETLSEARQRAMRLRSQLVERGAHPRLLRYCVTEIDDDNYFHAVLEASKGLMDEIRRRTGRTEDGGPLIDAVFELGTRGYPLLALNTISTETERSRQNGLANALRGIVGSLRNPTAHGPKIKSALTEQDAVDELGHMSYLHRRLDECHEVGNRSAAS
jgi:uncharacterized protein (TIGR02391 family)